MSFQNTKPQVLPNPYAQVRPQGALPNPYDLPTDGGASASVPDEPAKVEEKKSTGTCNRKNACSS